MLNDITLATDSVYMANSKAYALNSNDFAAISIVKNFLAKNVYKELVTVDNHLVCLSEIRRRLSCISAAETRSGLTNWNLRHQIAELKDLTTKLKQVRADLLVKLTQVF